MKALVYKFFFLALMISISNLAVGQYAAERITTNSVPLGQQGELTIENKYGDIFLNGWDKDSVRVKVDILVKKKSKEAAEELLDRIETSITPFGSYVTIKTEIGDKGNSFLERLFNDINPLEFDKSDVDINYEISLPRNASLEVNNDFGDIIITDWNGKLNAILQHGDLKVTEPISDAKLNVSFGTINARNIGTGTINLKNGKLKLTEIKDLRLQSSGSEHTIESVRFLDLKSSKDEIRIEKIGRLKAQVKFSTVFIDELDNELFLDLNLADIRVGKIIQPNAPIYIKQNNSEVDLNISGMSFSLRADLEGGILRLPNSTRQLETKMIDEKNKTREINAEFGSGGEGRFTLEGKKGYIILREIN